MMLFLRGFFKAGVFPTLLVALGGCSWVPTDGPYAHQVRQNAAYSDEQLIQTDKPTALPYALVKLTPEIVSILGRYEPRGLSGAFPD
jgi:polysaccharide export outer membrane protein